MKVEEINKTRRESLLLATSQDSEPLHYKTLRIVDEGNDMTKMVRNLVMTPEQRSMKMLETL